jgi:hypothetical protein
VCPYSISIKHSGFGPQGGTCPQASTSLPFMPHAVNRASWQINAISSLHHLLPQNITSPPPSVPHQGSPLPRPPTAHHTTGHCLSSHHQSTSSVQVGGEETQIPKANMSGWVAIVVVSTTMPPGNRRERDAAWRDGSDLFWKW